MVWSALIYLCQGQRELLSVCLVVVRWGRMIWTLVLIYRFFSLKLLGRASVILTSASAWGLLHGCLGSISWWLVDDLDVVVVVIMYVHRWNLSSLSSHLGQILILCLLEIHKFMATSIDSKLAMILFIVRAYLWLQIPNCLLLREYLLNLAIWVNSLSEQLRLGLQDLLALIILVMIHCIFLFLILLGWPKLNMLLLF